MKLLVVILCFVGIVYIYIVVEKLNKMVKKMGI